jgi:hypothetical protein
MRKFLFVTGFLAICSCSSLWAATVAPPSSPEVGVTIPTGMTTDFFVNLASCSTATNAVVSAPTSTCFSGSGNGTGFTWTVSGDEDPSISWTFGSTLPGNYTVTFVTPIVGGLSYDMLQNAASLTITNLTGAATTVTDIDVKAEVPAGNNIGAVELMDPSFSVPAGGNTGTPIGDASVSTAFPTPASMEVVLSYTATGSGSVSFSGQALLTTATPEPNNFAIAGLGMLAVLFLGRRKFRQA